MELALAIAVTVGPIGLILALLLVSMWRRLHPRQVERPPMPWRGPTGGRGGRAGDRSPNRPRVPTLSGGAALDLPIHDDVIDEVVESPRIAAAPTSPDRLAG